MLATFFGGRRTKGSTTRTVPQVQQPENWTIEEVPSRFTATVTSKAETIETLIAQLTARIATLLPIEADLKDRLTSELVTAQDEKKALERGLDRKFRRLDMGFLRLAKSQKGLTYLVPTFGIFDVEKEPECFIRVMGRWIDPNPGVTHRRWETTCNNHLMWKYANFSSLVEDLARYGRSDRPWDHILWARFSGVIPDHIRERITTVRQDFDQILIVAEVPVWQQMVPHGDPLVVGRYGSLFWLVDKFDTTSIEEYVAKEFTATV
jgi:hypothetical protein